MAGMYDQKANPQAIAWGNDFIEGCLQNTNERVRWMSEEDSLWAKDDLFDHLRGAEKVGIASAFGGESAGNISKSWKVL